MFRMRKIVFVIYGIWLSACSQAVAQAQIEGADRVLLNGKIYTVDAAKPWAEAVAIRDGRFVFVGDNSGAREFIGNSTVVSDLGGHLVIPGIIDSHTHPGMMGLEQYGPALPKNDPKALLAAVKAYADTVPDKQWVRMCCWPNSDYIHGRAGPDKRDLDAIVPDKPVWLTSSSWHSYWLNSKALEVLGVDRDTPDPRQGIASYVRDDKGELTGWVKEGAGWQHFPQVFPVDQKLLREGTVWFLDKLSENGVTTVYDGGNLDFEDEVYSILADLDRSGKLPLRYEGTYMIYSPERRRLAIPEMRRLQAAYGGHRLKFRTIKLFMDGITAERSGAMLEPYADNPSYVGTTLLSKFELRDLLLELNAEKFDLHVHAIGDLAVRTVLDAVQAARAAVDGEFYPRVTIAHLQSVDPADFPRFAELGVSANFTPWWHNFARKDRDFVALGSERSSRLYMARPLFESAANVTFGSDDWTPDVLSPFLGMQVGHNRQLPPDWFEAGDTDVSAFLPPASEKLDMTLMIRGYTLNGAYPLRMEDQIGSIATGKLADLVALDGNLFTMDPWMISKTKALAVMMEGDLIHGELQSWLAP